MKHRIVAALIITGTLAFIAAVSFAHIDLWWQRETAEGTRVLNPRILVALVVAFASYSWVILLHAREAWLFLRSRRAAAALHAVLVVVIALVTAGFLNRISQRRYLRFDVTARGVHTLSERTTHVLASLAEPLRAHVFVTSESEWYGSLRGLLDSFAAASEGKLVVDYIHPGRERSRFIDLLQRLGIEPRRFTDPRVVVFERPSSTPADRSTSAVPRTRHVNLIDLLVTDRRRDGHDVEEVPRFRGEEEMLRAVLAVARDRSPVIAMLAGHGELELLGAPQPRSLAALERALTDLDYRVEPLRFDRSGGPVAVPAETDVIAIVGAEDRFTDAELRAIEDALARGVRALVLTEPLLRQQPGTTRIAFDATRIEEVLAKFGIVPRAAKVRDPQTASPYLGEWSFAAQVDGLAARHVITEPLAGLWVAFHDAQPLDLHVPDDPKSALVVLPILTSLPTATTVDVERAASKPEELVLAAAARKPVEGGEARLVVIGDASVASDKLIGPGERLANLAFLLNAIGWLAEREETISVPAKAPSIIQLRLDPDRVRRLWLLCLVELPLGFVLIAFGVWASRR